MWVLAAFLCLLLISVLAVRHFLTTPYHVPSQSMAPTLNAGEYILVDRTHRQQAERGDVVVFNGAGYFALENQHGTDYWVKRVIGVGGDRVKCCNQAGQLTINGQVLREPYLPGNLARASAEAFDVEVPKGRIFVLGDNRNDSSDSRDHLGDPGGGMIPVERVQGRVSRVVWPLSNSRVIEPYNDY